MKFLRFLLTASFVVNLAASVQAALIPANRLPPVGTWESAGVPGGIPDTSGWTLVDVTAARGLDNTGAVSAVAQINSAIAAAAPNTVLYISAGTYLIDGTIAMNKSNIVLRGATDASFGSTGATIFNMVGTSSSTIAVGISSFWNAEMAITGGNIPAGTSVLTVSGTTGIAVGRMVRILQDNDPTLPVIDVFLRTKLQGQLTMVTNVSGNNVTISPALIFPLQAALNPTMEGNSNIRSGIGIENIFLDGTNKTAPYTVRFNSTYGCWIKGCQSYNNYQYHIYWAYALQSEFRHNTISLQRPLPHGPNMSGLKLDSSCSNLIVDNIFFQQFPSVQINGASNHTKSASAGNVIAYNFSTGATNGQPAAAADYISSHGPHTHYDLFEGNYGEKFQQDGYFGSSSHMTVVRNLFTGDNPLSNNNNKCIDLCRFTRHYNVVGNILGSASKTFVYKPPAGSSPATIRYIYRFGFPGTDSASSTGVAQPSLGLNWADAGTPAGAVGYRELDLDVEATTLLKGNYNTLDAGIPASEATAETALTSYFYSSMTPPYWMGTLPWPAYDANSPVFSREAIPAGYRFVHGVEAPGVTGAVPPPPPPPPVVAPSNAKISIQVN